jgi:hypothetical protein
VETYSLETYVEVAHCHAIKTTLKDNDTSSDSGSSRRPRGTARIEKKMPWRVSRAKFGISSATCSRPLRRCWLCRAARTPRSAPGSGRTLSGRPVRPPSSSSSCLERMGGGLDVKAPNKVRRHRMGRGGPRRSAAAHAVRCLDVSADRPASVPRAGQYPRLRRLDVSAHGAALAPPGLRRIAALLAATSAVDRRLALHCALRPLAALGAAGRPPFPVDRLKLTDVGGAFPTAEDAAALRGLGPPGGVAALAVSFGWRWMLPEQARWVAAAVAATGGGRMTDLRLDFGASDVPVAGLRAFADALDRRALPGLRRLVLTIRGRPRRGARPPYDGVRLAPLCPLLRGRRATLRLVGYRADAADAACVARRAARWRARWDVELLEGSAFPGAALARLRLATYVQFAENVRQDADHA